jgi:hypothetical protein
MTSKYKIIGLVLLIAFVCNSNAQEQPILTNYTHNPLTINPAIAGTVKGLNMNFLTRQQWVGIEGYPLSRIRFWPGVQFNDRTRWAR